MKSSARKSRSRILALLAGLALVAAVHDETEKQAFIASGLSLYGLRSNNHSVEGDFKIYSSAAKATPPVPGGVPRTRKNYKNTNLQQLHKQKVRPNFQPFFT